MNLTYNFIVCFGGRDSPGLFRVLYSVRRSMNSEQAALTFAIYDAKIHAKQMSTGLSPCLMSPKRHHLVHNSKSIRFADLLDADGAQRCVHRQFVLLI